jgi:hypothetical protein
MLAATSAFLRHDRPGLLAAKERLTAASSEQTQTVEKLIENFGSSYADALLWHRLCPTVAVPKDALSANRSAADKVAKAFSFPIVTAETNPPNRCIWIEQRPFAPNSRLYGYVIIHTGNGTVINASNQYWLDEAVERFIKSTRQRNGWREARFGLMSNFDVVR